MTNVPITPTEELEDQITEIIYGADWKNDPLTYTAFKPDVRAAMALFEQYATKRVIEELSNIVVFEIDDETGAWYEPDEGYSMSIFARIKQLEASLIDKEKA